MRVHAFVHVCVCVCVEGYREAALLLTNHADLMKVEETDKNYLQKLVVGSLCFWISYKKKKLKTTDKRDGNSARRRHRVKYQDGLIT